MSLKEEVFKEGLLYFTNGKKLFVNVSLNRVSVGQYLIDEISDELYEEIGEENHVFSEDSERDLELLLKVEGGVTKYRDTTKYKLDYYHILTLAVRDKFSCNLEESLKIVEDLKLREMHGLE